MLITYKRKRGTPLTPEQLREIEDAKKKPVTYDADCPEMSEEQLHQFRRVHPHPDHGGSMQRYG